MCTLREWKKEWNKDGVCVCKGTEWVSVGYVKGLERGTECVSVCVGYVKGIERGTEWLKVCV